MRAARLVSVGWLLLVPTARVWGQEPEVVVGMVNEHVVPAVMLARARTIVEQIFAGIGMKLKWQSGSNSGISMQFDISVAPSVQPGARGYAMPYAEEGTRIHILVDRIRQRRSPAFESALLGHVMAHELGHVLGRFSRHSGLGLMKASWGDRELTQMLIRPLSFSGADAELIQKAVRGNLQTRRFGVFTSSGPRGRLFAGEDHE